MDYLFCSWEFCTLIIFFFKFHLVLDLLVSKGIDFKQNNNNNNYYIFGKIIFIIKLIIIKNKYGQDGEKKYIVILSMCIIVAQDLNAQF